MYTGNPLQPFPQQQQQQFALTGQFSAGPNGFGAQQQQQPFTGSQNNPFSSNWTGPQQPQGSYFGTGAGWTG